MAIKFSELEKLVPMLFINHAPVHLIGPPGCGKSQWVENRVPEVIKAKLGLDIDVKTTMLTTYEACDVGGFKVPAKVNNVMRTVSTAPEFVPDPGTDEDAEGIMFWDERSQAYADVQNAIAPLVLSNKAGVFDIPKGWRQWSASNRMSDKSNVVRAPSHLINRERTFEIEPDVESWCDNFAGPKGLHHLALGFARFKAPLFDVGVPAEPKPFLTLRSYSEAWRDLTTYVGGNEGISAGLAGDYLVKEIFASSVGVAAAVEMAAYLKLESELKTWDQIMNNPTGIKIPAGRYDIAYSYMGMVISNMPKAKNDISVSDRVMLFVTTCMPKELQVATIMGAARVQGLGSGALACTNAFKEYSKENKALIHAAAL